MALEVGTEVLVNYWNGEGHPGTVLEVEKKGYHGLEYRVRFKVGNVTAEKWIPAADIVSLEA